MRKKLYFISFLIILFSIVFLNSKSNRYIGVNYVVEKHKISNFQKLSEFYERHINYKKLVKEITDDSKNKEEEIKVISTWIYNNIKKISNLDEVIDNHPWTIVERKMGVKDQFSDILSVLLVYNGIESFFEEFEYHQFTFFKYNNEWSIIDPYYGVYFINNENYFSTIKEIKNDNFTMRHLTLGEVTSENFDTIFFDKDFKNINQLNNYFNHLLTKIHTSKSIDNTSIYDRGGRSHIQKPMHRIFFQIKKILRFN